MWEAHRMGLLIHMGVASVPVQTLTWAWNLWLFPDNWQNQLSPPSPPIAGETVSCWRENWLMFLGTASRTPVAGR